jgi:DUF1680 family protein
MMWNWRMLAASGEAKFADVIERALYNGVNSGMSLDGTTYCYRNPLAFDPSSGEQIRNPWYDVTCCPPNLERTFASLPGYFYSTSKDGLYVHLYDNSLLDWPLEDGTPLKVQQKTNYPWDGEVQLTITPADAHEFTIRVRIPWWADGASVAVNGKVQSGANAGEYLAVRRNWKPGDTVRLSLPMSTEVVAANPRVTENRGRVAVRRGPIIYCMEGLDQPNGAALADISLDLQQAQAKDFQAEYKADLLDGVTVLRHRAGVFEHASADEPLYGEVSLAEPKTRPENVTFIPYYVWANRQSCAMEVWVPYLRS